jgi:hypothetical protein
MPMIPLGLKETKEIEMQEPFRVCPTLSVSYTLLIVKCKKTGSQVEQNRIEPFRVRPTLSMGLYTIY